MKNKLWGGRFTKKTNPLVEEFTKSIQFDHKLARCDILGSMAHVKILEKAGYLTSDEAYKLDIALTSIQNIVYKEDFKLSDKYEDIHTYIQSKLQEQVGDLALKMHTARSRNDQVVFATKLYCKDELIPDLVESESGGDIPKLIAVIEKLIADNEQIIIPGFTHLQHAQPVYLKDYLQAYIDMLERDVNRLNYISKNMKITLGAGALAGTPLDFNYNKAAEDFLKEHKKWKKTYSIEATTNPIDSVSNRDFVIEIISALSIIGMHLSRLAEDLIIWSTKEFDFVEIDESFCTGSSLMPQKKNPDVLELIRGNAGRLYGNLTSVLTMMKGLPLTYNRDMQLDKEPLFDSFEIVSKELKVLNGLIGTLQFNESKMKDHLKDELLYATDLIYYLVKRDVPFAKAHTIVGELVKYSLDNKKDIKNLPEPVLKQFCDKFKKEEIVKLFDPKVSVESKKSIRRKKSK